MKGNLLSKKKQKKWSRRKKITVVAVSMVTALVIAGGAVFFTLRKGNTISSPFGGGGMGGGFAVSENMVGASGVISVGVTEECFEVENLSAELVIEEVYVSSNEEIGEGTKILKLTEDSVAEARKELEETLNDAELAYRAGAIEYEQNKITAQYDYRSALLSGEQAAEIYEETTAGLSSSIEKAQEELAEAQEQIAEYQSYVNDDSYRSYFKLDEYQALYDENLKILTEKMEEAGLSWEQVTKGQAGQGGANSELSVAASLYKVLEQNGKDLEQAQSDYEDALTNAAFELQTLELKLPALQQAVTEAQEDYEVRRSEAKLTYEKALATAERAESDYETALEKAEADYVTLQSDYEDARDNLELFESSVGDGFFYASGSGTVLRMRVRAEQTLASDSTVFLYSNPEEMYITVSVDQADIAKLTVGDEAYVQSTSGDGYRGTITAIDPVTQSDSRTNVTYSVTVTLSGDTAALAANQSVTVLFGVTEEEIQSLQQSGGGQRPDGAPQGDGQRPDGAPQGDGQTSENSKQTEGGTAQ